MTTLSRADPVIMTLDSAEFKSILTPEVKILQNLFKKKNYELRIAGGAVRDLLSGINPKDLDFATDATPADMKDMFNEAGIRMINEKGEKHGTITLRINDKENFEVTTLRMDIVTDGRRAQVEFTKNWKLDAHRRDLTINSMFLGLDGKVYDYFYGYDDLLERRIIFVGDPTTRICEDYLRILRYFRFYGRIAKHPDSHDEATLKAISNTVHGLECISGERIWSEWSKILSGNFAGELTLKMIECGLAKYIGLSENPNTEEFMQVWKRMQTNKVALEPPAMVAGLLNNHQEVMALHSRLKMSNYERHMIAFIIRYREDIISQNPLLEYVKIMMSYKGNQQHAMNYVVQLLRYKGNVDLAEKFLEIKIPRFPVSGSMLKDKVSRRNLIAHLIERLKDIWVDSEFKLTADDLLLEVPEILEELESKCKPNTKSQIHNENSGQV